MKNKFKRVLFFASIKTPIIPIILVITSSCLLLFVINTVKVPYYDKYEGTVISVNNNENLIKVDLEQFEENYEIGTAVLWYSDVQGTRYNGFIDSILTSNKTIIKNSDDTVLSENISDTPVYVEVFTENKAVSHKFWNKK